VRASQPALLAAGRVITELRDQMVVQWADWLGDRIDNLTDDTNASAMAIDAREAVLVLSH